MRDNKCKICRRFNQKLFLKGDKCFTSKCPMTRRPYGPGKASGARRSRVSEYGRQLMEKQKLRIFYGLKEKQFRNYIKDILHHSSEEGVADLLIKKLESRLDNVVYRMGFAESLAQSRQLVVHGHFLVNDKKVDRPSYQLRPNDVVAVKPKSKSMIMFQAIEERLKKREVPAWQKVDVKKLTGEILRWPTLEETNPPANISTIFEFYSR